MVSINSGRRSWGRDVTMHIGRVTWTLVLILSAFLGAAGTRTQSDALVIADFDGEKAETKAGLALWPYCDDQFGGTSEARTILIHPGAGGSRGALRISFRVTTDSTSPFAGVWAMVGPEGLATNLSAYRGVRFYARSTHREAFTAGIVRFPGQMLRYMVAFEVKPEWTLVELPFDTFHQIVTAGPQAGTTPFDAKDITSIGISTAAQARGPFEIDIDRLEVYR